MLVCKEKAIEEFSPVTTLNSSRFQTMSNISYSCLAGAKQQTCNNHSWQGWPEQHEPGQLHDAAGQHGQLRRGVWGVEQEQHGQEHAARGPQAGEGDPARELLESVNVTC